ncbi:MAG: alpha/beta fold hydrolase [Tatlockia sp.]|nr:alpha/beta fold hydrolase [Tatlockia sp.]
MIKTFNIPIPHRANTPATTLYVKIHTEKEANLKTKPYIFMLPGGPGANHSHYKEYCCLTDVGNIAFYDPRGCGLSEKADQSDYTMINYIEDLEVIRKHLSLSKIILLGKSYGAMCAIGYTLRYPEAVSKLVLAAGAANFKFMESAINHIKANATDEQKRVFDLVQTGKISSEEEINHYFSVMETYYSYKKRQGEKQTKPKPECPFAYEPLNRGFGDFLHTFDFENELYKIKSETLVLVGEEDWITAKEHSELIAKKITGSKLHIFPRADHNLEFDVPDEFFGEIKKFIAPSK